MRTLEFKRAACLGVVMIAGLWVASLAGCAEEGQTAVCPELDAGNYRYTEEDQAEHDDSGTVGPNGNRVPDDQVAAAVNEGCLTAAAPNAVDNNSAGGASGGGTAGAGGTP